MNLHFSYLNRERSKGVEDYLMEHMAQIEPMASKVERADAELIFSQHGTNVVKITIKSPKIYKSVVTAEHEHIKTALHQAIDKMKRRFLKVNTRMRDARRRPNDSMNYDPISEDLGIDADNVIKFEPARRHRNHEEPTDLRPSNDEICDALIETAVRLECVNADENLIAEYRQASRFIGRMVIPVKKLFQDHNELSHELALSNHMLLELKSFVSGRQTEILSRLRMETPEDIEQLIMIKGVGPRKAQDLFNQFKVNKIEDLEHLAKTNRLREVSGFSAKMEAVILDELKAARNEMRSV